MPSCPYIIRSVVPDAAQYLDVCSDAGLSVPSRTAVERGLPRSLCAMLAFDPNGRTLGLARVIGDGGIFFEIVDVAVRPKAQGRGIGAALVGAILDWLRENAEPSAFVSLHANEGTKPFYERLGFVARLADEPSMFHPDCNRPLTEKT